MLHGGRNRGRGVVHGWALAMWTVGLGQAGGRQQRGGGEEHQHGQGGAQTGVVGQDAKQRGEHATNADGQANGEATGGADASGKVLLRQGDLDAEREEQGQAKHGTSHGGKLRAGRGEQAGQAGHGQPIARSDRPQAPGAVGQPPTQQGADGPGGPNTVNTALPAAREAPSWRIRYSARNDETPK